MTIADEALQQGMLREDREVEVFEFRHALIREALYESLSCHSEERDIRRSLMHS